MVRILHGLGDGEERARSRFRPRLFHDQTPRPGARPRQAGGLLVEAAVALAILASVMVPLSVAHWHEQTLCRAYYHRAIAMEIIDGEMEVLAAGEWRALKPGVQNYSVPAKSAANLPPGRFVLTRSESELRLEWIPDQKDQGGRVVREVKLAKP